MAKNKFDVIVVGGGPGGSSTTAFLTKMGKKVLLLDKAHFPRDKICGDALSGKTISVLKELGWINKISKQKHGDINGVTLSSPKGEEMTLPFQKGGKNVRPSGYVVRRQDADNVFFQEAKKLADTTIEGFTVTDILKEKGKVVGIRGKNEKGKEQEYRAKVVVGADGAYSMFVRKLGIEKHDDAHMCTATRAYYKNVEGLTDNIEIHFIKDIMPGYFWIFPIDGKHANVGLGTVVKDLKKKKNFDLRDKTVEIVKNHPMFKERFKNSKLEGNVMTWQLPFGSKHQQVHGDGYVLVGDAAALIDPFSGEGVGNALLSGKIAAKHITKAIDLEDTSAEGLASYEEELWKTVNNELQTSYTMQKIGKIQPILNMVIHKAATKPQVKDALVGMLANEEAKKDLVTIPGLIKLMFFS